MKIHISTVYTRFFEHLKLKIIVLEIRSQFEDHLECLDIRLEQQKGEISDIQDYVKKRADIERKYSKDLEGLSKSMYNKHREILTQQATCKNNIKLFI
jgi:hypothetical protein